MINAVELKLPSLPELILRVSHQNSTGCYEIPKQLLSVIQCVQSC